MLGIDQADFQVTIGNWVYWPSLTDGMHYDHALQRLQLLTNEFVVKSYTMIFIGYSSSEQHIGQHGNSVTDAVDCLE